MTRPEADIIKNVVATPYINTGSGKDWFILNTQEEIKPVIFQDRQAPTFASLDRINDHDAFMMKKFYYGVDARFVTGYGDPRTAVMVHDQ